MQVCPISLCDCLPGRQIRFECSGGDEQEGVGGVADNAKTHGSTDPSAWRVLSNLKRKQYSMWGVVPRTSGLHTSEGSPSGRRQNIPKSLLSIREI
jgi:hypothetical protein